MDNDVFRSILELSDYIDNLRSNGVGHYIPYRNIDSQEWTNQYMGDWHNPSTHYDYPCYTISANEYTSSTSMKVLKNRDTVKKKEIKHFSDDNFEI